MSGVLASTTTRRPPGRRTTSVGPERAAVDAAVDLLLEIAVREHPRRLHGVAELHLPPRAPHLRGTERRREVGRLRAHPLARRREVLHVARERPVVLAARALERLRLLRDLRERVLQRLHELLDGLLLLPEPAGGELEERLVVLAQGVGREGVEAGGDLLVRPLQQGRPLLGALPLVRELDAERGVARAQDEPGAAGAEKEADEESDDHRADER